MQKTLLILAAFAGLTSVILGAFGAHGLKPFLTPDLLNMWEKAVQYQFYHTLAIITCIIYLKREYSHWVQNAAICFFIGILLFSGSLYLLATRQLTDIPVMVLGPITPIGGFFFIAGWVMILINALKTDKE